MRSYRDITWRYLKVQKKRTLLTLIGIILSVSLITAIGTMVMSMREKMISDNIKSFGNYHAVFKDVEVGQARNIKEHVDVDKSAVVSREGDAIISDLSPKERDDWGPSHRYLTVMSYDKAALKLLPIGLKEGRMPQNPGEILLEYWAVDYLPGKPKVGDRITLNLGKRMDKTTGKEMEPNSWSDNEVFQRGTDREFTIVGLIQPGRAMPGGYFASGITFMDSANVPLDKKCAVYVKLNSVQGVQNKMRQIAADLSQGQDVIRDDQLVFNDNLLRLYAQGSNRDENTGLLLTLGFLVVLIIVATAAVIYNAFNISVLERISQFGLLRSIGASPRQIRGIVFREAGILSAFGIPLGFVAGIYGLKITLFAISALKFELVQNLAIVVSPWIILLSLLLGVFTVYLSAFGPARKAGRISPLEAVRNAGSIKKENFARVRKSRIAKLLFGISGDIAFKNLRRNKARFRITVFSMVISITLYIIFGSFTSYLFKLGVVANPQGDFALWANGLGEGIDPAAYGEIKQIPGVEKVFKLRQENVFTLIPEDKINPRFAEIRSDCLRDKRDGKVALPNNMFVSYGDDNLAEAQKYLKEGLIDKEALNREKGVLLVQTDKVWDEKNHKAAIVGVSGFKVGDEIPVALQAKETIDFNQRVKVMGILDKGIFGEYNQNGGLIMVTTEQVFEKITGKSLIRNMTIDLKAGASPEPLIKYLDSLKEKDPKYSYLNSVEQAKRDRDSAVALSVFLYGFVVVIALIGSLNIVNTISTGLVLRTKELSVLQAVGMTSSGLKKLVGLEGIFYGIIAAFYGSILGTGLSYLLFRFLLEIREFEWSFPWIHISVAVVGAVLIALLSGYFPLRRLSKGNIMDNIRAEA